MRLLLAGLALARLFAQAPSLPHTTVRAGESANLPVSPPSSARVVSVHPEPAFPWAFDGDGIAIPTATPPGAYEIRVDGRPFAAISVDPPRPVDSPAPPIVVLNGWVSPCPSNDTFPIAAQLRNAGSTTLIFENCQQCRKCSIERLGDALAAFLNSQRDSAGVPIPAFDLLSHSMGGLIIRSYLTGKAENAASFRPPGNHKIRKWISVSTPNFGGHAALPPDNQLLQMAPGSSFLTDLASWNQGGDDLRGVDTLFVAGNAGAYTPLVAGLSPFGASDGAVSLTSASGLSFGLPAERTRILPYCHTDPALVANLLNCNTRQAIFIADSPQHLTVRIARSFFTGTEEWRSIGTTPASDPVASTRSSIYVAPRDAFDRPISAFTPPAGLPVSTVNPAIFGNDMLTPGDTTLRYISSGVTTSVVTSLAPGAAKYLVAKPGPLLTAVRSLLPGPAQGNTVRSGSPITLTGTGFGSSPAGVTLTVNDAPLTITSLTSQELRTDLPGMAAGWVRFKLTTPTGQHTLPAYVVAPSTEPFISAVVNGASFQPGFASGAWVTITGYNLAPLSRIWRGDEIVNGRLPEVLEGTRVTINGKPAYVYYISATQLNIQAPTDPSPAGADRQLTVEVTTPAGTARVTALQRNFAPALFAAGAKYAAAVHIDGSLVAPPEAFPGAAARAARTGDIVALYGTGLGAGTAPPVPAGQIPAAPATMTDPVSSTVGGAEADVLFAGLVGPGLYQINVRVPDLPDGDHAVVIRIGGVTSQNSPAIASKKSQ